MNDTKKKNDETRLQIYHVGNVTVVGFGGRTVNTRIDFSPYCGVLTELINRYNCRVLAVDLAGVKFAPAGLLSVLVSIRKIVERIEIHNPTETAKVTLATIQMDSLFDICESVA